MDAKPSLSIVLTFYNEQDVLEEMVTRLRKVCGGELKEVLGRYEMIFVNDRSTDRSQDILLRLAEGHSDIRIINMSRRFGVYPCMMAGFRAASGDAVVYLDSDLQDPPEVIAEMVKVWQSEKAEVVHTKRRSRAGESRIKLWITMTGYHLLRLICDIHIEPNIGDFKLMSRRVVNELLGLREKNPFVRGLVTWIGFKQVTILYDRDARFAGETLRPVYSWAVIKHFLDYAFISFSDIPLKAALFIGFFISFGTFCFLLVVVLMKVFGLTVPGWAAIMATMLLLGGIQLFTIGVLGLYVNSIFLETKNRPDYIVDTRYGFEEQNREPNN